MNDSTRWWQKESENFLNDTLSFINTSREQDEAIGRCDALCKALNKTWNAFFRYRSQVGELNETEKSRGERTDAQSFRELILRGINDRQSLEFCRSVSLRRFCELDPHVLNHDILDRENYTPSDITESIRKKASSTHRALLNAFKEFSQSSSKPLLKEALLKKTAELIYIVRCNIVHSEKTPKGPDLDKSERDRLVSEVTAKVLDDLFDIFLDSPSKRLAIYGTLTPDGPNASQLASLEGEWCEGSVQGVTEERNGLLEFRWLNVDQFIPVNILSADGLSDRFVRLDRFEGPRYQRVLVPVKIDGKLSVCNIYASKRNQTTPAVN